MVALAAHDVAVAPASPLRAELVLARREVGAVLLDAFTTLRWAHRSSWRVTVLTIWAVGIALDAGTTWTLLRQPGFAEGNALAAAGMTVAGLLAWVVAASVMSAGWALLAASPTEGPYAQVVSGVAVVLGLGKLAVGTHNLLVALFGA